MWFALAIILIPLIEIRIFAIVIGRIGALPTFLLCLLLAIAGFSVIRSQGFRTLAAAQNSLIRHEMPGRTLFDGICLTVAGILLIIPGFLTDMLAFALMVPAVRAQLFRAMAPRFDRQGRDPSVIDGEFTRVEPDHLTKTDADQS
jgi:UPF0716 protein FxsA